MRIYSKKMGFSLLELILVIVLLGILASGAGMLITTPIKAYSDQLRRTQLVDQAEMALRQIARDIRRALPNSIRIQQNLTADVTALEMVSTVAGARYRDQPGVGFVSDDDILDFSSDDTNFNLLGSFNIVAPEAPNSVKLTGQRLVIYNTAPTDFYANANANSNPGIVTPASSTLNLSQNGIEQRINISPGFQFSQSSPGQRVFLIDGPISYICDTRVGTNRIDRYTNYAYQDTQVSTNADLTDLADETGTVATQVTACSIDYDPGTAQRGGIITLSLTLQDDSSGEAITLLHQVHVVNVP
jgi:MSHA biogenesis protein MshO